MASRGDQRTNDCHLQTDRTECTTARMRRHQLDSRRSSSQRLLCIAMWHGDTLVCSVSPGWFLSAVCNVSCQVRGPAYSERVCLCKTCSAVTSVQQNSAWQQVSAARVRVVSVVGALLSLAKISDSMTKQGGSLKEGEGGQRRSSYL